jgi:hypothetical protein
MESTSVLDRAELRLMYLKLGQLRLDLIERYPKAVLKDPQVFDRAFATVRASQERVLGLLRVAKGPS